MISFKNTAINFSLPYRALAMKNKGKNLVHAQNLGSVKNRCLAPRL